VNVTPPLASQPRLSNAKNDCDRRRPLRHVRSVLITEVRNKIAVAFDQIDDLENVAVDVGGQIAKEDQIVFERNGADVLAQFRASATQQSGERREVLALVDDPARKANGCIFATDRSDLFGDLDKVVPRAVKETKVGHLRACLQPVGNGTAHAIRAVGASPRNGRIERFAEGGPLHLIDRERNRILGRGETPACDFGFQPSFLIGRQGDVHAKMIEMSEPAC
jgi:hypothetical protein